MKAGGFKGALVFGTAKRVNGAIDFQLGGEHRLRWFAAEDLMWPIMESDNSEGAEVVFVGRARHLPIWTDADTAELESRNLLLSAARTLELEEAGAQRLPAGVGRVFLLGSMADAEFA